MISKKSKIFLAGHNGMVGSAILKKLKSSGFKNIITISTLFFLVDEDDVGMVCFEFVCRFIVCRE